MIVGRGAVAIACAARLAAVGVDVAMPEARSSSVTLRSGNRTVEASVGRSTHPQGSDLVIFAVKAHQLEERLCRYRLHLAETRSFLVLGNGIIDIRDKLPCFGAPAIFEGTVNLVGDGQAELHSLSSIRSPLTAPQLGAPLANALRVALAFEPLGSDAFLPHMLKKFAIACTSARMVLSGVTIGSALGDPGLVQELRLVADEALSVMGALYDPVAGLEAERLLEEMFVAWRGSGARLSLARAVTSLHADLARRHGSTEIDWLNGLVEVVARRGGPPAPLNTFLASEVTRLADQRLTPSDAATDKMLQDRLRGHFCSQPVGMRVG